MEATLPLVEITVKEEPVDSENVEESDQNGLNEDHQQTEEVKEDELWIKAEPYEDDSQDSIKEEDQGTVFENEAKLEEEALDDEYNRNRQSNAPSRKQLKVFLDFLNEHRDLANCMLRGPVGRARANQLWEAIAERLNRMGGCIKTTHQWLRVWSDKKYLTRKAAAARFASLAGGGALAPELTLQDEKILAIIGEAIPPRRVGLKSATPEPKPQTPKQPQDALIPSNRESAIAELEPHPTIPPEQLTQYPEVPIPPKKPPRKPYTPRKTDSSRKDDPSRKSAVPPTMDGLHQPDMSKPPDEPPRPVNQKLDDLPSSDPLKSAPTPQGKDTKDLKSTLPLKKRLEKIIKLEDGIEETAEEKHVSEENEQKEDVVEPKMETPLMYSYETLRNIEIVTIDEEERCKEFKETLKSRQHMRHVCKHCALGFVLQQAFDMHMKVHAPESGDHECLICHSRLKSADMLYRHRLRHFRRYRCLLCRTRFKDKDTAACHVMNDHAGQTFECDHCGRGFKRPQYLKRHVQQHHTKPHNLECGVCFRVFHERGWYRTHIRTHNEEVRAKTVRLPATCQICSRDYKNKASLKRHLLTHDEDVHCDICYEKCKNKITLGNHYLKVHNEKYVGPPEQTCTTCERLFSTRAMLKRHMQRMHSDRTKKYQCDYCQRLYLTKGEVRSHITWSHMPAEARGGHACTCGRIFRSPSLLRDHKARFHSSQPPPRVHQCDNCEKAFANKQVLNRHKKVHSNEMYPCKECGLLFKTQPYVKVHYQLKHLNMTREQIKAQRRVNKTQSIQDSINRSTNWEPPIANKKKKSPELPAPIEEDPLMVPEGAIEIKIEKEDDEFEVPTFQAFMNVGSRDVKVFLNNHNSES